MNIKKIAALLLAVVMVFTLTGCKSSDYKKAMALFDEGKFSEAKEIFVTLGDYKDSVSYAENIGWYALYDYILENGMIEYEATEILTYTIEANGENALFFKSKVDESGFESVVTLEIKKGEPKGEFTGKLDMNISGVKWGEEGYTTLDISEYKPGDAIEWEKLTAKSGKDPIVFKDFSGVAKTFFENMEKTIDSVGLEFEMEDLGFKNY